MPASDMHKVGLIAPLPTITRTVAETHPEEETVTMIFPKDVTIVDNEKRRILFKKGPQEVPVSLKDNWYLKANKVELYTIPQKNIEDTK
jgi:hypothetical protein